MKTLILQELNQTQQIHQSVPRLARQPVHSRRIDQLEKEVLVRLLHSVQLDLVWGSQLAQELALGQVQTTLGILKHQFGVAESEQTHRWDFFD